MKHKSITLKLIAITALISSNAGISAMVLEKQGAAAVEHAIENTCPICLDEVKDPERFGASEALLPHCSPEHKHASKCHKKCLIKWLKHDSTKSSNGCPICKQPGLTPEEIPFEPSALIEATKADDTDLAFELIENGEDLNSQDEGENTALMIAITNENISLSLSLIRNKADLDLQNSDGYTALMLAVDDNQETIVRELIQHNADIDIQNHDKETALMWAITEERPKLIQILLENDANVNLKDYRGNTALHQATRSGNMGSAKTLIQKGANTSIKNKDGKTPLDLTKEQHIESITESIEALNREGADTETN